MRTGCFDLPMKFRIFKWRAGLGAVVLSLSGCAGVAVEMPAGGAVEMPGMEKAVRFDREMKGGVLELRDGVVGPTLKWGGKLEGDWALSFWVLADAPKGEWGKKTLAICELRNDASGARLAVQLRENGAAGLIVSAGELKKGFSGTGKVGFGEWHHFVVTNGGGELRLFVDGSLCAKGRVELPGGWNAFTVGRAGSRLILEGAMWNPRVLDRAVEVPVFEKAAKDGGYFRKAAVNIGEKAVEWPALQVSGDHPLIDQLDACVAVAPWTGRGKVDLLMRTRNPNWFGARTVLFSEVARDGKGFPVYGTGRTLVELPGKEHEVLMRADGLFDLLAIGEGTVFGTENLVLLRGKGTVELPVFEEAVEVPVGGKSLSEAAGGKVCGWVAGDVDGDGVEDLLVAVTSKSSGYWPDGDGPIWNGIDRKDAGRGKGYDTNGEWLGKKADTELRWAKGRRDAKGRLEFGELRTVFEGVAGNAWKWNAWTTNSALAVLRNAEGLWIVHAGAEKMVMAMRVGFVGEEMVCAERVPLLEDGRRELEETYFPIRISVADMDGDGMEELVLDGNPGRVVVLKGRRIGKFREAGTLMMRGGDLAADTLTTPVRVDWTGDGREDLITGDASGRLVLWRGTESPLIYGEPEAMRTKDGREVKHVSGEKNGSIQGPGERVWGYLQPTAGDWAGDGKPAIITNDIRGELMLYRRTNEAAVVELPERFLFEGKALRVAWRSRPDILSASVNFAGSGKACLLFMDFDGDMAVGVPKVAGGVDFERVVKLRYEDGKTVRVCGGGGLWGRAKFCAADWTGGGKWDVVFGTNGSAHKFFMEGEEGNRDATPLLLENVGTVELPVFRRPRVIRMKDGRRIVTGAHNASVWVTDLDGDGRNDLIIGGENGKVYYFYRKDLSW